MKCIRCQHDSKYKERTNRKCPHCHGDFAFEPRSGDLLSDMAWLHAVERVSAQGQIRWGVEHLYYEICRRKRWPALLRFVVRLFGTDTRLVRVSPTRFDGLWRRWVAAHGNPKGLIVRQPQPSQPPAAEPDLADYSFDRAVVTDRARTADLLLANNFHFENNCAVLSVDGYPPGPFATVRAMLKRNPRLQVFALHDATVTGCGLAHRLATEPEWFARQAKVFDLGLRPIHAKRFHGLLVRSNARVLADNGISDEESRWLSKYTLELAAIRPEQVLKRLFRAINRKEGADQSVAASDGSNVMTDGDSFGTDAGTSDDGGDSFG